MTRYGIIGDGSEATFLNGARNNFYYKGALDELRLYHRVLNQDEIDDLYGIGKENINIIWLGIANNPPSQPEINTAYYDYAQKASYIWDGGAWNTFKNVEDSCPSTAIEDFLAYEILDVEKAQIDLDEMYSQPKKKCCLCFYTWDEYSECEAWKPLGCDETTTHEIDYDWCRGKPNAQQPPVDVPSDCTDVKINFVHHGSPAMATQYIKYGVCQVCSTEANVEITSDACAVLGDIESAQKEFDKRVKDLPCGCTLKITANQLASTSGVCTSPITLQSDSSCCSAPSVKLADCTVFDNQNFCHISNSQTSAAMCQEAGKKKVSYRKCCPINDGYANTFHYVKVKRPKSLCPVSENADCKAYFGKNCNLWNGPEDPFSPVWVDCRNKWGWKSKVSCSPSVHATSISDPYAQERRFNNGYPKWEFSDLVNCVGPGQYQNCFFPPSLSMRLL